jgi:hypothetical protein
MAWKVVYGTLHKNFATLSGHLQLYKLSEIDILDYSVKILIFKVTDLWSVLKTSRILY